VSGKRARIYDFFALLTVLIVVIADQWTKSLVVRSVAPGDVVPLPVVGHFLAIEYTRNNGAAFSSFTQGASSSIILAVLIVVAIVVVGILYARIINTGPLAYKLIFGLIIGGALGNLLDRALHGGYVVDFISFRIPELHYAFAIFNIADACISVGVVLLLLLFVFGNFGRTLRSDAGTSHEHEEEKAGLRASTGSRDASETAHDAQSK
jgi:signal peptidase II